MLGSTTTTSMLAQLHKLTPSERRFLRAIAEGFSLRGAASMTGLSISEASGLLEDPRANETVHRLRRFLSSRYRQTRAEEAARVVGVNEAYILSRAKALELDPETEPRDRVAALKFLAEAIGLVGGSRRAGSIRGKDGDEMKDVSNEELAKLAAKGDT